MDLDDRLRANLRTRAQQIPGSPVAIERVEARGRRRRRRRGVASGVTAVVLLGATTVGAIRLLETEDRPDVIAAGALDYPLADSAEPLNRVDDVDLPTSETDTGVSFDLMANDGDGLLLIRAVGSDVAVDLGPEASATASLAEASIAASLPVDRLDVYRSIDGSSWELAGSLEPPVAELTSLDRVAVSPDGTVVVSGTAFSGSSPDGQPSADVGVIAATNDLATWSWTDTHEATTSAQPWFTTSRTISALAAGPGDTVAVVDEIARFDPNRLLQERAGIDLARFTAIRWDDQGIGVAEIADLLVPPIPSSSAEGADESSVATAADGGSTFAEVQIPEARSFTWDELGVTPEVAASLTTARSADIRRTVVAYDDQGARRSETELAIDAVDTSTAPAAVSFDGGLVVTGRLPSATSATAASPAPAVPLRSGTALVVSRDGLTWEERAVPIDHATILALGEVDGRLLVVVDQASDTLAAAGDPFAGSWDIVRLPVESAVHVVAGGVASREGSAAVVLQVGPSPASAPVSFEDNGYRVSFDEAADTVTVIRAADGVVIWQRVPASEIIDQGLIRPTGDAMVVLDPDGSEIAVLPSELFQVSTSEVSPMPSPVLLWSPDGNRWSSIDTGSDTGFFGYDSLAMSSDRLFLRSVPTAGAMISEDDSDGTGTGGTANTPPAAVEVFAGGSATLVQRLAVFEIG